MLQKLAKALRAAVGVVAGLILLWSVVWIAIRPLLRREEVGPGQVQLRVLHWGDDREDQIVADLVAEFERHYPHIKVRRINPGTTAAVNTKFQTMVAAGDPPDVLYMDYAQVANFAEHDLVAAVDAFLEADRQRDPETAIRIEDYYANVLDCFCYDGEAIGEGPLYGLPKDFTTVGFYYNKDLFRKAGIPEPPDEWTWDEFIAAARKIAELPNVYGAEFITWEAMIRAYLWTYGYDVADRTFTEFHLTDPGLQAALEKLYGWFVEEGRTLATAKTMIETREDLFLTGRVGMVGPYGRWKTPVYLNIEDFDWDFAPLPCGTQKANAIFTTAWALSSQTAHPQEAWKFIKFMSGPEGQRLNSLPGLAIPAMISVAESEAFTDPNVKPTRDDVYLAMVTHARPLIWPPDTRYLEQMRVGVEEILKQQSKTVAQGLTDIQREWERIRRNNQSVLMADYPPMPWATLATTILGGVGVLVVAAAAVWWWRRPGTLAVREEVAGMAMVSPWVIGFAVFTAFPIVMSLLLAFGRWSGLNTLDHAELVGWDNFRQMLLYDPRFRHSLQVTLIYVVLAVPLGQLAALGAALLMNHEIRGIGFFRAAWYLPSVLAGVAVAVLWRWVFHGEHGLLNALLEPIVGLLGGRPPDWFGTGAGRWGVPAFVVMSMWTIGGGMMIYLAGLKGIPTELYEAAHIDGATGLRRFRAVTLPMLSPVIFFNFIIAIILSFQVFTQAYVMTGGGPGDATRFYVLYLFNRAFDLYQMGYASAMAWLLLIIVLVLTLVVMAGSKRFVYYEALKA